jgi:hypothetical protein
VPDFADSTTTELERKLVPLRWASLTETVTYCVLFFFWVTGNRPGRLLMGSLHGMIFLAFAAMVLGVRAEMRWTWQYTAAVIILGPAGSLMVYSRLRREGAGTLRGLRSPT